MTVHSPETVRQEIENLKTFLANAIRSKKPGREEAEEWADRVDREINRALGLLASREQHPELEESFVELETLAGRADEDLFRYGTSMELSKYV